MASHLKQVTFDVDEIEAKNLSSIESIEIGSASEDEHKTIIELQEIYPEKWYLEEVIHSKRLEII